MQKLIPFDFVPGEGLDHLPRGFMYVGREWFFGCGLDRSFGRRFFRAAMGFLAILFISVPASALAADISIHNRGVLIQGTIEQGDYAKVIQFIQQPHNYERFARTVFLDSPGGDLVETIRISHLLDKSHAATVVAWGAHCRNACFVLWMSGVTRFVSRGATLGGNVVLKRSRPERRPSSERFSAVAWHLDHYLTALGTPRIVVDMMNTTSPTDLFIITPRWLAEQQFLTSLSYRPVFFDLAQTQCGPEPYTAIMLDRTPLVDDAYSLWVSRFRSWNDCVDALRGRLQKTNAAVVAALIDEWNVAPLD